MNLVKKIILIIVNFLILSSVLFAAEGRIGLSVENTVIELGERVNLTVDIVNVKKYKDLEIKGLENFHIISTNSSRSTNIINGKRTDKKTIYYDLMAKDKGKYNLIAYMKDKKKTYKSNLVSLEVKEKLFEEDRDETFILSRDFSKKEIYFGEKLFVSYYLDTTVSIEDYSPIKIEKYKKFQKREIPRRESEKVYYKGRGYRRHNLKNYLLNPLQSGEMVVGEESISVSEGRFRQRKVKKLNLDEDLIKVLALPEEGKPENFKMIVGNLNMDAEWTEANIEYGDSITMKIKLYGNCDLQVIKDIVSENDDYKVYEQEKSFDEKLKNGKYFSEKSLDIILVPKKKGIIKFEGLKIPYFNTDKKMYDYVKSEAFEIKVRENIEYEKSDEGKSDEKDIQVEKISYDSDEYYHVRIKKTYLKYGSLIFVVILLFVFLIQLILKSRKKDDYKTSVLEMKKEKDYDEKLNKLNEILKKVYGINIKAYDKKRVNEKIRDQDIIKLLNNILEYKRESVEDEISLKLTYEKMYKILKRKVR